MREKSALLPIERIERHILLIRGEKVMLDSDLAKLYRVTTSALNQAVKRNADRFPHDFMFQLTVDETSNLKSHSVTSSSWGGRRRSRPVAFTEQGVAMLSSVLRSDRAVQVNVQITRTFVKLRQMLSSNAVLARKLAELEQQYDRQFRAVFDAIRQLMTENTNQRSARPLIGFRTEAEG
jgi:hypothetical protein